MLCYWYPHWRYIDEKDGHLPSGSHSNVPNIRADFQLPKKYEESRDSCSFFFTRGSTDELHPFTKSTENGYRSAAYSIALVELLQIAE